MVDDNNNDSDNNKAQGDRVRDPHTLDARAAVAAPTLPRRL